MYEFVVKSLYSKLRHAISRATPHGDSMKNLIIIGLFFGMLLTSLFGMVSVRAYHDEQVANQKLERKLYVENLKREYYQYRDSTATGHSTDKAAFPRYDEMEALSSSVQKQ
jgi:hypothetical protein